MSKLKNWKGVACVIGVDWGDSGKGRLIDDLAQNAHIVARFNGGSNTGHTIKNKHGKFALHIIPSGIFNRNTICIVGKLVAVDLESLIDDEFKQLKHANVSWKNLRIDEEATLVMPWHKLRDGLHEESRENKIGTTRRGVGPTYADRIERSALRVKDLMSSDFKQKLEKEIIFQNKFFNLKLSAKNIYSTYQKYAKAIKPLVTKTIPIIKKAQKEGKDILFEGAQGYFLDIDAGTYPFVTSSNTGVLGIWRCFDIHPTEINHIIGITKAYMTRVGAGPMPTKIESREKDIIIKKGKEIGTTSGRVRDPGWLDLVLIKAACASNRINHMAITKVDIFSKFKKIKMCTGYKINKKTIEFYPSDADFLEKCVPIYTELDGWSEDISKVREFSKLPANAKNFIKKIEKYTGVSVDFIGVGPERNEAIYV